MPPAEVLIRDVRKTDVAAAVHLLNREILAGVNTFRIAPIDDAGAAKWWRDRGDGCYPAIAAWDAETRMIGWAALSQWSLYEAYRRTAEVSIWIDHAYQGKGYGTLLFGRLVARARALQFGVLLSRIEASNEASIRLHERFGFRQIGTMHRVGEKFGRLLDVVMLECQLDSSHRPG